MSTSTSVHSTIAGQRGIAAPAQLSQDDLRADLARAYCQKQAADAQYDQAEQHLRGCEAKRFRIAEIDEEIELLETRMSRADTKFSAPVGNDRRRRRMRQRADMAAQRVEDRTKLVAERDQLSKDISWAENNFLAAMDYLERVNATIKQLERSTYVETEDQHTSVFIGPSAAD